MESDPNDKKHRNKDLLKFEKDYNFGSKEYEDTEGQLDHKMIFISEMFKEKPIKPDFSSFESSSRFLSISY